MTKPARDALVATLALVVAIWAGSGRFAHLDPALLGYLGATVAAFAGATYRASAFWRRRASAFYGRTLGRALRDGWRAPRTLGRVLRAGTSDLVGQTFIARRSRMRWLAHVLLSLGTLASFAITVPLVLGWLHFIADGDGRYQPVFFGVPGPSFAVDGPLGWLLFHALALAGVAVALGATTFLVLRVKQGALPGTTSGFHVAPLVLLLVVALTGLALPASRHAPLWFDLAAAAHEVSVIVLLVAIPFSKLHHVLVRPLQLGARVVRAPEAERAACTGCGVAVAPLAQQEAVRALLAARGVDVGAQTDLCPACRRRRLARTQATLVDAHFHPPLLGARPARDVAAAAAARAVSDAYGAHASAAAAHGAATAGTGNDDERAGRARKVAA